MLFLQKQRVQMTEIFALQYCLFGYETIRELMQMLFLKLQFVRKINIMKIYLSLMITLIALTTSLPCAIYGCMLCLPTQCVLCRSSYYLNNEKGCSRCGPNCANCTNHTSCLACQNNYYIDGAFCQYCGQQCVKCIDNIGCVQSSKYAFVQNGASRKCRNNQLMQSNYSLNCPKCPKNFSLINQVCIFCREPCSQCSINGCTSCFNHTYLLNSSCISCSHPCLNCRNSSHCLSCQSRYYLQSSTCLRCGDDCNICANSAFCTQCIAGYYLANDSCLPCGPQCKKCTNNTNCNTCRSGYQLSNSSCIRVCTYKCNYCLSNYACLDCEPGFYLFLYSSFYLQCSPCRLPCTQCINQSACTSCSKGYYLTHELNCLSCDSSCLDCVNNETCSSCKQGYFYNNSICLPCLDNCAYCTQNSYCEACLEYYYLANSSACLPCQLQHCLLCVNTTICSQCEQGYYVSRQFTCLPCGEHCVECLSFLGCLRCNDTIFSKESICYFSFPNCSIARATAYTSSYKLCMQIGTDNRVIPNSSNRSNSTFSSNFNLKSIIWYIFCFLLVVGVYLLKLLLNKITEYFLVPPQQIRLQQNRPSDVEYAQIPDQQQIEDNQANDDVCSICLISEGFFIISCGHTFHASCIYQWIKDHNDCPICRAMIIGNIAIRCRNCREQGFKGKIRHVQALKEIAALKYFVCQYCNAQLQDI